VAKNVTAVILAAGKGTRLGTGENKAYVQLAGRPLLSYCLHAFDRSPLIDEIVLVIGTGEEERARRLIDPLDKDSRSVCGGITRRDSALAGVEAAEGQVVLVHDAARPFPSLALIKRVVEGTISHRACVPVIPVVDTLRYGEMEGRLTSTTVERKGLLHMQTPQGFERALIRRCLALSKEIVPDDAGAVLVTGAPVWTVPGDPINLKVTTQADLILAEAVAGFLAHTAC